MLEALDKSERECMLLGLTIVLLNGQASETRQHLAACYSVHLQDTRRTQGEISALKGHLHALRERNEALDISSTIVLVARSMTAGVGLPDSTISLARQAGQVKLPNAA